MELKRSFTGKYRADDVDEFINEIRRDYEETLREQRDRITELRDENKELQRIIEKYKMNENYIIGAITKAEETAESILKEAKIKAKIIMENAEKEEQSIRRSLEAHCQRLNKLKRASEAVFRAVEKAAEEHDGEQDTQMRDYTKPFSLLVRTRANEQ